MKKLRDFKLDNANIVDKKGQEKIMGGDNGDGTGWTDWLLKKKKQ